MVNYRQQKIVQVQNEPIKIESIDNYTKLFLPVKAARVGGEVNSVLTMTLTAWYRYIDNILLQSNKS